MNRDRSSEVLIRCLLRPQWPFVLLAMTALVFAATPLMNAQSANPLEGDARAAAAAAVAAALREPGLVWLDVRSDGEARAAPMPAALRVRRCACTMFSTAELARRAPTLLPDRAAPILVFCAGGGRAGHRLRPALAAHRLEPSPPARRRARIAAHGPGPRQLARPPVARAHSGGGGAPPSS